MCVCVCDADGVGHVCDTETGTVPHHTSETAVVVAPKFTPTPCGSFACLSLTGSLFAGHRNNISETKTHAHTLTTHTDTHRHRRTHTQSSGSRTHTHTHTHIAWLERCGRLEVVQSGCSSKYGQSVRTSTDFTENIIRTFLWWFFFSVSTDVERRAFRVIHTFQNGFALST